MSNPKAPPHVTRLRKDCRCRATASGPRIVIDGGKPYGEDPREHADAVEVTIRWIRFACDACDREWLEVVDAD